MKIEDKIFKFGLLALDELLLHRNSTKKMEITIEDAEILSDMIIHVGPHPIFTLDEEEIADFYYVWRKAKSSKNKKCWN